MAKAGRKAGSKLEYGADWIPGFLAFYSRYPNVMRAARAAGVDRSMIYKEAAANPKFKAQLEEAKADGIETIEGLAMELASKNRDARHNSLRMFMLKAHKPDVYRETLNQNLNHEGSLELTGRIELVEVVRPAAKEEDEGG
jgi:hypothetical protein